MKQGNSLQQDIRKKNKFYLTEEEYSNLMGRREVRDYAMSVIKRGVEYDMKVYIETVIRTRLKIPKEKELIVNFPEKTIEVAEPQEAQLKVPNK